MDTLPPERRSNNMRRIRSSGMKPELMVRRMLHRFGYRYRIHVSSLPGKPDIVFTRRRKAVFVHGCFWHQHTSCVDGRMPLTRREYWGPKLTGNVTRDATVQERLRALGWQIMVVWECECEAAWLPDAVRDFLGSPRL